jgi:hypothetical protein
MKLDRKLSAPLKAALQTNSYRFLLDGVRFQPQPGFLDLRFRSNGKTGESEVTLYFGERAAARLKHHPKNGLSLAGPAKPLAKIKPEGLVHVRLCCRADASVLDREAAFRFTDSVEKKKVLADVCSPIQKEVGTFAKTNPSFGAPPKPSVDTQNRP